ncbi:MAG: hypothetical protein UY58_C0012G0003 [Candidatus Magasanikbacteria bacterium GW2011_GWA2_50_22]|uniref:Uncharacterized protein n=1 Tax=Candidatus Magasanikbacteria bacterium GW2011_GWA2_50_22 TaxID=1619043 RepID=A0A0G1WE63_9BACT|nr:MAG: hypothetical protein UY58_C0012G0003 [Candidatus Magasanikbacteria bacterium GW2011_GWA2_50_22]
MLFADLNLLQVSPDGNIAHAIGLSANVERANMHRKAVD